MKFKGDTSGLDKLRKRYEKVYIAKLKEIAIKAVDIAHRNTGGNGLKQYQNHTWHLRTAPGACIVDGGKVVWSYTRPDADAEATQKTEAYLFYRAPQMGDGLFIADGMQYASFVRAKGYDVLDSATIYLRNQLRKK